MSTPKILLYDIPTNAIGGPTTWSPNVQKTRFALNYKRLPFSTSWIEFLDIEPTFKQLGISPHAKGVFASTPYTVPAIIDSSNESDPKILMESSVIASYLDATYPARALYRGSPASQEAQKKFLDLVNLHGILTFRPLVLPTLTQNFSPPSAEYYRRTREAAFGTTLEGLITGPKLEEQWTKVGEGLNVLAAYVDEAEKDGKQVLLAPDEEGKLEPTYAAFVLVSVFAWLKRVGIVGGWDRVRTLNDGQWGKLWDIAEPYLE